LQSYRDPEMKNRGSITPFMCIFIAAAVLFNAVLVDCARMLVMRETVKRKTYFCAESLTADYMKELHSTYGLYGLYLRDGDARRNAALDFVSCGYSLPSDAVDSVFYGKYTQPDFFEYGVKDLNLTYLGNISEPAVLKENICELMKYKVPADLLTELIDKIDMFKGSTDSLGTQSVYTQICEIHEKVLLSMDELEITVNGTDISNFGSVSNWKEFGAESTTVIITSIEGSIPVINTHDKTKETVIKQFESLKNTLQIYSQYNRDALDCIDGIKDDCSIMKNLIEEFYRKADELDFSVETNLEYYRSMKPKIKSFETFADSISYSAVRQKLLDNIEIMTEAETACNTALMYLNDSALGTVDSSVLYKQLDTIKNIDKIKSDFKLPSHNVPTVDTELSDYDISDKKDMYIKNAFDVAEAIVIPEKMKALLPSVENVTSQSGDLSEIFDVFSGFAPDATGEFSSDRVSGIGKFFSDAVDTVADSAYINEYAMSFFFCNSEDVSEERFFNAEIEYIISGESEQQANVDNVFKQIMAIRTAMNFTHILLDSTKFEFANQVGASIASATMGMGAPIYAFAVMGMWAVAEAAIDMIDLKEGESVPFYKSQGDWKLDIGLDNIGSAFINELTDSQTEANKSSKESPLNMSYKEYLRILLLAVPQDTKLLRIADLIELNMSKSMSCEFDISEVYTGIACDLTIVYSPLVNFEVLKKGRRDGKYEMRFVGNSIY